MRRFTEKTALVTGGAHGIGLACARRLAAEGATVAIADVDMDAAADAASAVNDVTREQSAFAVACDVTQRDSVEQAVAAVVERCNRLDVLVSNVGIASAVRFADTDDAEWNRQLDPTLTGSMRVIRAALPHLLVAPGGGAVVATASVNGLIACGGVAYSAAKAGVINAMKNLAAEFGANARGTVGADRGWVRFNAVAPGTTETRAWTDRGAEGEREMREFAALTAMGRSGLPDEIAAAVAFLASSDASWITGVALPVDGGLTVGPLAQVLAHDA
ncbi:SDR family NAD(P)-dependent oxidoreductase [Paramicrobacterium agarici]|uniref:SDR family NAD(P)-dependent oxidoreductase n=1 Tax=Paramicrobacterium agarici TaxID=630514 RepID=UPI00114E6A97|nr:SDR family NAD(P)-dependent oxidoreductase [Microbacterium agarici]TQO22781.1 NAD(P)-dependent dehydrogenase (short-subunit alcohol dehydrogenase family) [Microbacterium agarici]